MQNPLELSLPVEICGLLLVDFVLRTGLPYLCEGFLDIGNESTMVKIVPHPSLLGQPELGECHESREPAPYVDTVIFTATWASNNPGTG